VRKVLVVDDSALVRRALSKALGAAGLAVHEESSVATGASVDVSEIACAVLDLELDDGDGTEIATKLRAQDARIAIAFFSAGAEADVIAKARALGRVFMKPAELDDVVAWARSNA
jgi:DNA-binding response OmpR family regulator